MNAGLMAILLFQAAGGTGGSDTGVSPPNPTTALIDFRDITTEGKLDARKLSSLGLDPSRVTMPKAKHRVAPQYPGTGGGREAQVELDCRLTEAGLFEDCSVAKSGGHDFNRAAQDAVKEWRYTPFLVDGKPRALGYHVTMRFTVQYQR